MADRSYGLWPVQRVAIEGPRISESKKIHYLDKLDLFAEIDLVNCWKSHIFVRVELMMSNLVVNLTNRESDSVYKTFGGDRRTFWSLGICLILDLIARRLWWQFCASFEQSIFL